MTIKHTVSLANGTSVDVQLTAAEESEPRKQVTQADADAATAERELQHSDGQMAIASENLIEILINKGVISSEDLSSKVTKLLSDRKNLRKIIDVSTIKQ